MRPSTIRTLSLATLAVAGLGLTTVACGCGTRRQEKADFEERERIRKDGQNSANQAAGQGRNDLDRATSGDGK